MNFLTISQSVQIWQLAGNVRIQIRQLTKNVRTNLASCQICTPVIMNFLTISQSVQIWQVAKFVRTK